jgi:uncharacterized membrane protein YjgN (DUF898 family)
MALVALLGVVLLMGYMAVLFVMQAWFSARLQNQCWSVTRSQNLSFRSALSPRRLTVLMLKNLLYTVVTLGLYRPFAVVQVMKMRLLAVSVELVGSVDDWAALGLHADQDASGEMAGDFFGLDVGL